MLPESDSSFTRRIDSEPNDGKKDCQQACVWIESEKLMTGDRARIEQTRYTLF